MSRCVLALGFTLWLTSLFPARAVADTTLYNDGVWIVNGIDEADPNLNRMDVAVGGQPVGSFTEVTIARSFAGVFPVIYSIRADGGLQPTVPPNGEPGGSFFLTGYWDCFAGEQMDLRITTLNIQPNNKNFKALKLDGSLSNGTSLQSGDLAMKLDLPDNNVRLNVRYTLLATINLCVDQSRQQFGEGFQVARIASNYISNDVGDNDGLRVKGFLGQMCNWGCGWDKGYICANFTNQTGYVLPYQAWMAGKQLFMRHSRLGPRNTPALRVEIKSPSRSQCSVQGYSVLSSDPSTNNISLWTNWDFAKYQYAVGQKIRKFQFNLVATPPTQDSCNLVVLP